jgi:hypothetical protein
MTYLEFIQSIEGYVKVPNNSTIRPLIKTFAQEAFIEFARRHNWERLKKAQTIVTDGTGYYALEDDFISEISLMDDSGNEKDKLSYKEYLGDKVSTWSIWGTNLYIEGTGETYSFLYMSKGDVLSADDDESEILDYYSEYVKQWTIYKYLIWYGDDQSAAKEEVQLQFKLNELRASESRAAKEGRDFIISAHNR